MNTITIPQFRKKEAMSNIGAIPTAESHPVIPRRGAFILAPSGLVRFDKWVGNSTLLDMTGTTYEAEEVQVCTAAVYGFAYDEACGLTSAGAPFAGKIGKIIGWRALSAQFVLTGNRSASELSANSVAALVPALNPDTEKPKETIARLRREKEALEKSVHQRMVAEGVSRGWCREFDPILDAVGLPPREKKNLVTGTISFTAEISEATHGKVENILDQIKVRPLDFIPRDRLVVTAAEALDEDANGPMLSI